MNLHEANKKIKELELKRNEFYRARDIFYNIGNYQVRAANGHVAGVDITFVFKDEEIQAAVEVVLKKRAEALNEKLVALEAKVDEALASVKDID